MCSHRLGLVQPVSIVKQKNNSGRCLFWKRGHTDVRGELKKRHFSRIIRSELFWAMTPSFFDKVYRDGRTLLPLELGFFGLRVWGARVRFAFGCSRMLCCTSAASHGKDNCMSDVTGSDATSCPFYSTWCFIGTNLPQSKFVQQTPFNQWRICHCWCSAVTFIGNVSTLTIHHCNPREQKLAKKWHMSFPINLWVQL